MILDDIIDLGCIMAKGVLGKLKSRRDTVEKRRREGVLQ